MDYCFVESFVGPVLVAATQRGLACVQLPNGRRAARPQADWTLEGSRVRAAREQLQAYFAGRLQSFALELDLEGTEFQQRVWRAVAEIPFGSTESYGELARRIGRAGASRAVGSANAHNRLAIVVPCHRVIGSDGGLRGYAFGLARKRALLAHEQTAMPPCAPGPRALG